jgi:signal transduction histidine kinase
MNLLPNSAPVFVDSDLMKQAALNVAVNALEAMPTGGTLTFGVNCEPHRYVLAIYDTGPGIPAELRDKIFNLYFTTKQSGSGIGLAMTYRIMELHSGEVQVDSEPGKGACFRLRLPEHGSREVAA